jgi:pseudouridine-5'-phosphate glycosidase
MTSTGLLNRAAPRSVALETTLLLHGVPKGQGGPLARELRAIIERNGAHAAICGVLRGRPIVGMTDEELNHLLDAPGDPTLLTKQVPKANTSNLGLLLHQGSDAATTVSTTMELAASAGVRIFATGGLGGVHKNFAHHLDISADLLAFTRFPVAVVTSGCKSLLDVVATRELLETLGVPVIGFRTDRFPAFYLRESSAAVDARFDDLDALANFTRAELARTGRGIVIANPIPEADALTHADWDRWLAAAESKVESKAEAKAPATGRDATPALLAALHEASGGRTLAANLALVRSNAALAATIATAIG